MPRAKGPKRSDRHAAAVQQIAEAAAAAATAAQREARAAAATEILQLLQATYGHNTHLGDPAAWITAMVAFVPWFSTLMALPGHEREAFTSLLRSMEMTFEFSTKG